MTELSPQGFGPGFGQPSGSRQVADNASDRGGEPAPRGSRVLVTVLSPTAPDSYGELIETAKSLGKSGCAAPFAITSETGCDPDAPGPTAGAAAAEQMTCRVRDVRPALGELRAAVVVVQGAQLAARKPARRPPRPSSGLSRWRIAPNTLLRHCAQPSADSRGKEQELNELLHSWLRDDDAVELVLPELTADNLAGLEALVRNAVAPVRTRHEEAQGRDGEDP